MIKAILADDEPKALKVLEEMLQKYCPQLEVIATANSAENAYQLITSSHPDLIFLDVAMPEESGFDLLRRLPSLDFEIIFVTGFDTYAIDAIKFCAIGYVLKPIQQQDLLEAVHKAEKRISEKSDLLRNKQLLHNLINPGNSSNRIGVPTTQGLEFIPTDQIIRCEGEQKYTRVFIESRKDLLCSYNLGEFVKLLSGYGFFSPHKSHLINMAHIKRFDKEGTVTMTDESTVPVSRRKRQDFMEQLKRL